MNSDIYDDVQTEKQIKVRFGLDVEVKSVIARRVPVGSATWANVFLSTKGMLYVFIVGTSKMNLGDVKKILARMKLRPELFVPPRGEVNYFDLIGAQKFREVFPGREVVGPGDITFYRTLAPYSPALVQIAEVIDGTIKQYDTDAVGRWRPAAKFSYRRIRAI